MVLCSSIVLMLPIWSVYWIKSSIRSQNNPKQRLLGIIYIFDVSAEKNNFVSTPDRRQWKTLLTIDKRGSEIASTSVFDCHLLPVGWLMAIKNSVSYLFGLCSSIKLMFLIAAYPVWFRCMLHDVMVEISAYNWIKLFGTACAWKGGI